MMDINYQILFSVQLFHEYFRDEKYLNMDIFPAQDCKALFKDIDLLWRKVDHKFIALLRENGLHEPFINRPPDKAFLKFLKNRVFRLYLKPEDSEFFIYSNVPSGSGQIAYFNNLSNNKIPNSYPALPSLYLSQRIGNHQTGRDYLPGEFVMEPATDRVFESLQKHTATAVVELTDPGLWRPRLSGQFPTDHDSISLAEDFFIFPLSTALTNVSIKIYGFNFDPDTPDFTVLIKEEIQQFGLPATSAKIDFSGLLPGRYKLEVDGETRMVYFDPYLKNNRIYGVIEIFNYLPATHDYSFLDAGEVITPKDYSIRFPARNVLWKYIRRDDRALSITDTGGTNYTFTLDGEEFVSSLPIPLSEVPVNTLKLHFSSPDFDLFPLPNPSGKRLSIHRQNGYDYASAAQFLNY